MKSQSNEAFYVRYVRVFFTNAVVERVIPHIPAKEKSKSVKNIKSILNSTLLNYAVIQFIINSLGEAKRISTKIRKQVVSHLIKYELNDCIQKFAEQLVFMGFDNQEALLRLNFQEFVTEDTYAKINECFRNHFHAPDKRQQNDKDRLLRRMDSLARIFSFPLKVSACTAVAIKDKTLYISCNLPNVNENLKVELSQAIRDRVETLSSISRALLQNCTTYDHVLKECNSEALLSQLRGEKKCGVDKNIHAVSVAKIVWHIRQFGTQSPFSLFHHDVIQWKLLTPGYDFISARFMINRYDSVLGNDNPVFLNHVVQNVSIANLHAEQLLAYYLAHHERLNTYSIRQETGEEFLRLGISKLCCVTCFQTIGEFNLFTVRGTHNNAYDSIINIHTGTSYNQEENYQGPCNPDMSDELTPDCGLTEESYEPFNMDNLQINTSVESSIHSGPDLGPNALSIPMPNQNEATDAPVPEKIIYSSTNPNFFHRIGTRNLKVEPTEEGLIFGSNNPMTLGY